MILNAKKYLFLVLALVCTTGINAINKSLSATSPEDTFTAMIPLGSSTIEATFTITDKTNDEVMIGFDNFFYEADVISPTLPGSDSQIGEGEYKTAIDKSAQGKLTIPATVTDENGKTYTVTGIANHAFAECTGLTRISIPNTIKDIDTFAFYQCTGLTGLKVNIANPLSVLSSTFEGSYTDTKLFVPRGSLQAYSSAEYWKLFDPIYEFPTGDVNMDGLVNIQDVVATISYMLGEPTEPFEEIFADMNIDGSINITDVIAIINVILGEEE